jgi:hypothetical protein
VPRGRLALAFSCLLLGACAGAPSTAHHATPSAAPPSPVSPTPSQLSNTPPVEVTPAPAPSTSPTPNEMHRLAAATRALEASSSRALNARLASAYAALRDPARSSTARAEAARAIQLATAQLLASPAWRPSALAALRAPDRPSLEAILSAGEELSPLGDEVDGSPHWRISPPDPAPGLLADYHEGEGDYGIPWQYLAAINFVETAMGRIHGLSVAGAQGPMQFMPATWAAYGHGDVDNPHDAVLAAARYLHARGGPASMDAALYSYNRSNHYVRAIDIFAQQVASDPDAFNLYYNWQVIVPTSEGPAIIPEGWSS